RPDPNFKDPARASGTPGSMVSVADMNIPAEARKSFDNGQRLLANGKDADKSIELFSKAVKQYPQYADAYLMMGVAYSSEKKWADAERALRKALDLKKDHTPTLVALGSVENEQKNFSEAERYLSRAVEMAPEAADAQFELGRAYFGLEKWQQADVCLTKAN